MIIGGALRVLAGLDEDEQRWAACDPRHRHEIESAINAGAFVYRSDADDARALAKERRSFPFLVLR